MKGVAMINVIDVTYHYGVRPVLQDVNLHVHAGELVALMGPNGMGKSTLMAVIAGAIAPKDGKVEIAGMQRRRTADEEMEIRRKVVYLPAEPWLPTNRSGREWLLAVGRLYDVKDRQLFDHIDRLLRLFDLESKSDSNISSYSTGQRKKIALCSAIITEAPVMLLDEPFSGGLDPSGILALKRVLQGLAKRDDTTVLMATPVPELVEELAHRVAVVRNGQIIACDTPANLCQRTGAANLANAYEQMVNPQTIGNIESYFGREKR
jgi:ABC-type multidrug transport system ATPase subunit